MITLIFSYYFDAERTHVLNCGFKVENITIKPDKTMDTTFTAYIEEVENAVIKKKESYTATFTFAASTSQDQHDIDFIRTRYASQKKWIFEVRNNKDPNQKVIIGLISDTANKNPLGLDVYHESDKYDAILKANNLAQLEESYVPPVIEQTILNCNFDTPEYPAGFILQNYTYDSVYKLYEASYFEQTLEEPIKPNTSFTISLNIAPTILDIYSSEVFRFTINGVGDFILLQDAIAYQKEDDPESSQIIKNFDSANLPLQPTFFFNYGFKEPSKLTITGNGAGTITISYGGLQITGTYDASKPITGFKYKGAYTKLDNIVTTSSVGNPPTNAFDGNEATYWESNETANNVIGAFIGVKLSTPRQVKKVRIRQVQLKGVSHINIESSQDGITWDVEISNKFLPNYGQGVYDEINISNGKIAPYWRIKSLSETEDNTKWQIHEIQLLEDDKITDIQNVFESNLEAEKSDPKNWVKSKIDNLTVTYSV